MRNFLILMLGILVLSGLSFCSQEKQAKLAANADSTAHVVSVDTTKKKCCASSVPARFSVKSADIREMSK
jgi:hypothetical protein